MLNYNNCSTDWSFPLNLKPNGQLSIRFYDKRDDFNFAIIHFSHFDSNIATAPVYGVYISLTRLSRTSPYSEYYSILFNLSGGVDL